MSGFGCRSEGLPQALQGWLFPGLYFRRCRAEPGSKGSRLHRVSPALPPSLPAWPAVGREWVAANCAPCPDGGPCRRKFRSCRGGRGERERFCRTGERSFGCSWGGSLPPPKEGMGEGAEVLSHTPGQSSVAGSGTAQALPVPQLKGARCLSFPSKSPPVSSPAFRTARRQ